ncbi:carboxylate--amine ligase, partial [Bacillus safensis]|uniref:ATP-grasp domain-containing protein n=2 Tax=Bacillaceae TaxID=186817 RepID=UPI002FFE6F8B
YDTNSNVEYRSLKLSEKYKISHVVATSEYDLIRAASIRDELSLPGQNVESALAFRDKIIMKGIAQQEVMVPKYAKIKSIIDIYKFIKENGYPIVIKPIDGAGSVDTSIIKDENNLVEYLSNGIKKGFEIEEFIEGDMYTIDGLYLNGTLEFYWMGYYVNDCLSFNEGKQASNVQINNNHPLYSRLEKFIFTLVNIMPFPNTTTFHCEVFHTIRNDLILCEIASRTGGGGINELSKKYANINLNHLWVKGQCDLIENSDLKINIIKNKIFGWVQIPPTEGVLEYIPTQDDIPFNWVEDYKIKALKGSKFGKASKSSHKVAVVVVSGNTIEETKLRMDKITEWVSSKCVWSKVKGE